MKTLNRWLALLSLALASLPMAADQTGVRSAPFAMPDAAKVAREQAAAAPAPITQAASVYQVLNLTPRGEAAASGKSRDRRLLVIGDGHAVEGEQGLTYADLDWTTHPDGSAVAVAQVSVLGGVGFRLGLDPASLGALTLRLQGNQTQAQVFGPYTAAAIQSQRAGTGLGADDPYWLPIIEGDAVRLEFTRPAGAAPSGGALRVLSVSLLRMLPTDDPSKFYADVDRSGSCNINVVCQPTFLADAVAKYAFTTSGGQTGVCTGTLLNDTASSFTPWFVTANHCVSTQAQTSSMQFFWFFRSSTCQGTNPPPTLTTTTGGAALLVTNAVQDTTFLRLNQAPPGQTTRAGWTETLVALNTQVIGVHHPQGDLQKWSRGFVTEYDYWDMPQSPDSHLVVGWQQGTTEQGSSGSGIFNAQNQFVGALSGGGASCNNLQAPDWYGRFDRMVPAVAQWLVADSGTPGPGSTVTFSGRVRNGAGVDLCAMVLINGQYMFSCDPNGNYQLSFPLDAQGSARVFAFVDGFAPFALDVTPAEFNTTVNITMSPPSGQPSPVVTLTSATNQPNNYVRLVGNVRNGAGVALCAMVLANGQYMFSCDGNGSFDLSVPRAANGSVTLFTFVDGFSPFRSTFTP